jgi:hypothetical protein
VGDRYAAEGFLGLDFCHWLFLVCVLFRA